MGSARAEAHRRQNTTQPWPRTRPAKINSSRPRPAPVFRTEQKRKVGRSSQCSGNRVIVTHGPGGRGPDRTYNYDRVFSPYAAQEHVFEMHRLTIIDEYRAQRALSLHSQVFAYGPTGTGKTHTMEGTADDAGLAPRSAQVPFASSEKQKLKLGKRTSRSRRVCLEI